ncbi:hypothetical protein P3T73_11945 [Kiritimatiellota bacterium B12222]|nr:hypothetical protein P3T73_11945 [Kiritimatiellota bacterium B12222]
MCIEFLKGVARKDLVKAALDVLITSGDAQTLSDLREITNAPTWKLEMIENRMSPPSAEVFDRD